MMDDALFISLSNLHTFLIKDLSIWVAAKTFLFLERRRRIEKEVHEKERKCDESSYRRGRTGKHRIFRHDWQLRFGRIVRQLARLIQHLPIRLQYHIQGFSDTVFV